MKLENIYRPESLRRIRVQLL